MPVYGPLAGLLALPLLALIAGLVLAWFGWRGRRVGHHPACRRCGFDLFGRPEGGGACPECGADLAKPRAIVTGLRARRPAMLAAGAVLIVVGTARLAVDLRREVAQDPGAFKPAWWLAREARTGDRPSREAALAELGRRFDLGQLSPATVDSLTETALARQADLTAPWETEWGDWVERALAAGKLSDAQRERYFRQAVAGCYLGLKVRPRVRRGDPFPLTLSGERQPRFGGHGQFGVGLWPEVRFDDRLPIRETDRVGHHTLVVPDWPNVLRPQQVPYDGLGDGLHTIVISGTTRILPSAIGQEPVAEVPFRLEASWELIPAADPPVDLVDDPSLRGQIEPLVSAGVEVIEFRGEISSARVLFIFSRLPVGVAYDVILRAGEQEWPGGRVSAPAGAHVQRYTIIDVRGLDAEKVDVLLRPNPAAASDTLNVLRVWNHEIVLRDVRVTRRPARPNPGGP